MSKAKKIISVVIPCFNEQDNIPLIYQRIKEVIKGTKYNFEIIFIDNGSSDKTYQVIKFFVKKDKIVKGLKLSRNFGPEASVWAGIVETKGDAVVTIECDLQSPPELIPALIKRWEEGFDSVVGVYGKIDDYLPMIWLRKLYYFVLGEISQIEIPANATGFGLMDRKVVEALKTIPEKNRFYRGLKAWLGFKTTKLKYKREQRKKGKSSYNLINYLKHAEKGVFGFSYLLLDAIFYGSLAYLVINILLLLIYVFYSLSISHFSLTISIIFTISTLSSIQFVAIGIIGKYVQVISEESKSRPVYIVEEQIP